MSYLTIEDYPYIKFEIDGKAVTLTRFADYSREPLQGAIIDYAFSGNSFVKRTPYQAKFMWNITVYATQEERNKFWYIVQMADSKIYTPPFTEFQLTLSDVYSSIVEGAISRQKADPFQQTGEIGDIEYFAKFLVGISLNSVKEKPAGDYVELSFIATELEKLSI